MKLWGAILTFPQGRITISIDPDKVENIFEYIEKVLQKNILEKVLEKVLEKTSPVNAADTSPEY